MIIDQLENAVLYNQISKNMAKAFTYLKTTDFTKVEIGKYEIDGKNVFAMVSEYQTKEVADAKWEAHKNYADIQVVISGAERMGYAPLGNMNVKEAYNSEKDIVILTGSGDYVTATPGSFIVFFPQDAHQPCVSIEQGCKVKKVVVKVSL